MGAGVRRKGLFRLHSWIGLNLGLLLFAVCFSGTVAVFSPELNWLADPSLRVTPPSEGPDKYISWQALHDSVAKAYPEAKVLYLFAPRGKRSVARAAIAQPSGGVQVVLVDPYTGDVQGLKSGFNVTSFFRIFHKQLYIVPAIFAVHGTWIVGGLAILLLMGAMFGLLSMTRWRRAFMTLRWRRSRRLFWSDLHRLTGIWALAVTLVLTLTGLWYLVERGLIDAGAMAEEAPPPRLSAATLQRRPAVLAPLDLDRAATLARTAYPELTVSRIALPARVGAPLVFSGQAEAWVVRHRANHVALDPYSGAVLDIRRGTDLGAFERWIETADPLHFGTFGGLASRIVWFVAGLFLCAGILSGLYSAWLRVQRNKKPMPKRRLLALVAVFPTVFLLAASIVGAWLYGGHALKRAQSNVSVTPLMRGVLGPWQIAISRFDGADARAGPVRVGILFEGGGHPNYKDAVLRVGDAGQGVEKLPVRRFNDRLLVQVPCPRPARAQNCELTLRVDAWGGAQHAVSVDLQPTSAASRTTLPIATGVSTGEGVVIAAFVLCLLMPLLGWARLQFRPG